MKKKLKFKNEKPISKEFRDLIEKMLTKDPEKRITMYDLQSHPWMEMLDEELEQSIEDSKVEEEEEEKKKQEEDDLSYMEQLNINEKITSAKPTFDPNSLSINKGKPKKFSSPRGNSPRSSKVNSSSLNGSLKKKSKGVKKKKKPAK